MAFSASKAIIAEISIDAFLNFMAGKTLDHHRKYGIVKFLINEKGHEKGLIIGNHSIVIFK